MIHVKIEDSHSPNWLRVEIIAATTMSFEVKIPKKEDGYDYLIRKIGEIVPVMMRVDCALMEAYDDAFRSQPKEKDIIELKKFVMLFKFKNVNCHLTEFESIKNLY